MIGGEEWERLKEWRKRVADEALTKEKGHRGRKPQNAAGRPGTGQCGGSRRRPDTHPQSPELRILPRPRLKISFSWTFRQIVGIFFCPSAPCEPERVVHTS